VTPYCSPRATGSALVECVNFSVDESALTGESVPVRKPPLITEPVSTPMGNQAATEHLSRVSKKPDGPSVTNDSRKNAR